MSPLHARDIGVAGALSIDVPGPGETVTFLDHAPGAGMLAGGLDGTGGSSTCS